VFDEENNITNSFDIRVHFCVGKIGKVHKRHFRWSWWEYRVCMTNRQRTAKKERRSNIYVRNIYYIHATRVVSRRWMCHFKSVFRLVVAERDVFATGDPKTKLAVDRERQTTRRACALFITSVQSNFRII